MLLKFYLRSFYFVITQCIKIIFFLLALSPDTSVSVFTWQVNIYGQGKPSMYLGLFDINRWYHAQMPDSLRYDFSLSFFVFVCVAAQWFDNFVKFSFRSGEYLHNCSYFALWSLESVVNKTYPHYILDVLVNERSLSRGIPPSYPPPEQFFNANIYNFGMYFLNITFWEK